jgi:cytoplasmic iron level regulating protein YaaA (DUF328/UPF0246 family)
MYILFSPSEGKDSSNCHDFNFKNLPFHNHLGALREDIFNQYISLINSNQKCASQLTGLKNEADLEQLRNTPLDRGLEALYRYNGVAYKYLDPKTIHQNGLDFLNTNLIIFSNIFGPIFGNTPIPYYKLKQGQSLDGFKIESHYKPLLNPILDEYLQGNFVLDLRAGFYEKFYSPKIPYSTMQFFKDGKKVSHWAKAYRGKVARELSKFQPQSQSEFEAISFEGLHVKEILHQKNITCYCFNIIDSL